MSTTRGPNLDVAQAAVERLMDDTCTIDRDPDGQTLSTLDEETGSLAQEQPLTVRVYSGPVMVRAAGGGGTDEIAGQQVPDQTYQATLPKRCPPLQAGDLLTMTSSRRDPGLVGLRFHVRAEQHGTFAVSRRVTMEQVR